MALVKYNAGSPGHGTNIRPHLALPPTAPRTGRVLSIFPCYQFLLAPQQPLLHRLRLVGWPGNFDRDPPPLPHLERFH